jgi:hypothetical protein
MSIDIYTAQKPLLRLYVRKHRVTKLKYLGMTARDCKHYLGSGSYWKSHLKKHGRNVATVYLFSTYDQEEFSKKCLEISAKFDIVNSDEWANLCVETGEHCANASCQDKKAYNNGVETFFLYPNDPRIEAENLVPKKLVKNPPKTYDTNSGKKIYNDGVKEYTLHENDPKIAELGLKLGTGKIRQCYNDGVRHYFLEDGDPKITQLGLTKGRNQKLCKKSKKYTKPKHHNWSTTLDRKCYNDGKNHYFCKADDSRISELGLKLGKLDWWKNQWNKTA